MNLVTLCCVSYVYIGKAKRDITCGIAPSLLALPTLCGTTKEIGSFLFFVTLPKVAKASTVLCAFTKNIGRQK
jgi:hypothetical protein